MISIKIPVASLFGPRLVNGRFPVMTRYSLRLPPVKGSKKVTLHHGDVLNFYDSASKYLILNVSVSYDFSANAVNYDMIVER